MQSLVQIIDTIMVGRLGPEQIAAIGLGNTLRMFVFILVMSVAAGSMSLVAQAKGGRDSLRISFISRQSLISGLIVSLILALIGILISYPVLNVMEQGGNANVVDMAYSYLIILFLGTPFLLLNFVVERLMQGAGDMKTPLYLNAVTIVLNILLNYILIFGMGPIPSLGLNGAAFGTILARALSFGVGMYILYSGKNVVKILPGTYKPDWSMFKDIFAIGLPSGLQGVLRRGANLLLIGLITATELGTFGAAALAIGWQIEQLLIQPIVGLNVSSTAMIGHALGRWQVKDAIMKGNILLISGLTLSLVFILPVLFYTEEIIRFFDPSAHPTVMVGAVGFFKITMLSLPFAAISVVITGILRGTGDTRPAMYSTLVFRNIITVGLGYLFAFQMDMGATGIWWGMVLGRLLDCIVMLIVWLRKNWLKTAISFTEIFRIHLNGLSERNMKSYLKKVRAPMMAVAGTQEIIDDKGVTYSNRNGDTRFIFRDKGYLLV
mgnify:CR=1 FL=1|tara:strand:+ start:1173 stop:2651 length:1479 start_codon:yes stop_codon:yes gene_type:complete